MGLSKGPPEKKLARVGKGLDINFKKPETNSKQTTPLSSEIQ